MGDLPTTPPFLDLTHAVAVAVADERHRCAEAARKLLHAPGGPAARAVAEVILAKILDPGK